MLYGQGGSFVWVCRILSEGLWGCVCGRLSRGRTNTKTGGSLAPQDSSLACQEPCRDETTGVVWVGYESIECLAIHSLHTVA